MRPAPVPSLLDLRDWRCNVDATPGQAAEYLPVYGRTDNGLRRLLFTRAAVNEAERRGHSQPEDFGPPEVPPWVKPAPDRQPEYLLLGMAFGVAAMLLILWAGG